MELVLLPWEGPKVDPIGHADGMIRYIDKNKVLITNYKDYNEEHYNEMMKVLGPKPKGSGFNVISLHFSDLDQFKNNKLFSVLLDRTWCYINYLQVGTRILSIRTLNFLLTITCGEITGLEVVYSCLNIDTHLLKPEPGIWKEEKPESDFFL